MTKTSVNLPFIVSHTDEELTLLQNRFQDQGYLYFKSAIKPERCDKLLQQFLATLSPYIGFDEKNKIPTLLKQGFGETDEIWDEVYPKMQALEGFHRFFHEEATQNLMKIVAGNNVFSYPMKLARISTPNKIGYETPPHQDAHSHQSGPTMAGMWVALHDVKSDMGRLKMLPGSHKQGVRKVVPAEGVGNVQCEIFEYENTWHVSDVEQGDVIIFHSCCIHKAEANTSQKNVRLSIDTRFCEYGEPVFITNIEPHHGWRIDALNWDFIYQDWKKKDLQYYWKDYPEIFSVMK